MRCVRVRVCVCVGDLPFQIRLEIALVDFDFQVRDGALHPGKPEDAFFLEGARFSRQVDKKVLDYGGHPTVLQE